MGRKKKEELTTEENKTTTSVNSEAKKNYELAIAQIEKSFGKGSVMSPGTQDNTRFPHLSSGAMSLDIALGGGGFPFGRIIEVYGPNSCGKTTLLLSLLARAQRKGIRALFVDAEQSVNISYAKDLGVDIDSMEISQPSSAEEALTIIETIAGTGYVGLILLDSIAALTPQSEKTKDMTESEKMMERAKILSRFLPRIVSVLRKNKCLLICSNQLRKTPTMYGSPDVTPGGEAMKYYASQRLEMRMFEKIQRGEEIIGQKVKVKTVKNKMNSPFKEVFFNIIFGKGIDSIGNLIEVAVEVGVVEKSGTWFSHNGQQLGQGMDQVKMNLMENPDKAAEIEEQVLAIVGPTWGEEGQD